MLALRRVGLIPVLAPMHKFKQAAAALIFVFAFQAWGANPKTEIALALAGAKSVSLLSLEPGESGSRDSDGACAGYCYFGWPVLGQTVTSPTVSASIRKDLSAWLAAPAPEAVALCFNPRHGIRVVANGHIYDFVVCFQCSQAEVFKDSAAEPIAHLFYYGSSKKWDLLLSSAHVPLASPAVTDGS